MQDPNLPTLNYQAICRIEALMTFRIDMAGALLCVYAFVGLITITNLRYGSYFIEHNAFHDLSINQGSSTKI